ncbi:phospholipase A and acyltransferase 2-like [Huso huso]|uniref:Phospholipase A and acyltransferase 2-like n=1 Tax=Huso huso TaxID=61971 RepID=A0ABR0YZ62_HUSHU
MTCNTPRPGDLIEFDRVGFYHWGIYVGDGYIVHLSPADDKRATVIPVDVKIRKEKIDVVAAGQPWRVNNLHDATRKHRSPQKMVQLAEAEVGKTHRYDLAEHNCEHFVTELRYGVAVGRQGTIGVILGSVVAAAVAFSVGATLGGAIPIGLCVGFCLKKLLHKTQF